LSVLIFTDATSETGLGHFTRCCALAEILIESNKDVTLAVTTDAMPLPDSCHEIKILRAKWHVRRECEKIWRSSENQTIVVDSYMTTAEDYDYLVGVSENLYCLDDDNRLVYPAAATIINPGLGGKYIDYQDQHATIMTGAEFVLLRRPFREFFDMPVVRNDIESILITVGGEDRWNVVPALLSFFTAQYARQKKHVVIGPGFYNRETIKANADHETVFHEDLTALEMRDLMLKCDVAITGGGQTTNELARCGIPMIVLQIADNQRGNMKGLLTENLISGYCEIPENAIQFVNAEMRRLARPAERFRSRFESLNTFGTGLGYVHLFN
jgi:UDP-2,4-diacetamido-2,4,6-trideoxy-beta-L-altropyranose hydrolase